MSLDDELGAASARLTKHAMDAMYADPFWMKRFGERGRKNADTDGDFHIKYLREAVAQDSPTVFENYARWLRTLLVSHGMCTRHLAENFAILATAIDAEPWAERARAVAILRAGERALAYTDGPAAPLEAKRAAVVAAVAGALSAPPDVVDTYASYALDAIALAMPSRFTDHVAFAPPPAGLLEALHAQGFAP